MRHDGVQQAEMPKAHARLPDPRHRSGQVFGVIEGGGERSIANDPCMSCAANFLKMEWIRK